MHAQIAQLVEQRTENPRVTGSIPVLGITQETVRWTALYTCGCSSMVEHQPSKLDTWVRFPSPASCAKHMPCVARVSVADEAGVFTRLCVRNTLYSMREWLSGGAPPCQGGGRGFDPRLALF